MSVTGFTATQPKVLPHRLRPGYFHFNDSGYAAGDGTAGFVRLTFTGAQPAYGVEPTDHLWLIDVQAKTSDTNQMNWGCTFPGDYYEPYYSNQYGTRLLKTGAMSLATLDGTYEQWAEFRPETPLYLGRGLTSSRGLTVWFQTNTNAKNYFAGYSMLLFRPKQI